MDKEKIKSSILGFITGDALGVPYEFIPRQRMKLNPATKMVGDGSWEQPIGTWSDDTSMVLATLDCLSTRYDLTLLGSNFHQWYYLNEYTPHGKVFDIGAQTRVGIDRINDLIKSNKQVTPIPPSTNEKKNGNGSLMRILPFGFYLRFNQPIEERYQIISDVSSLTHSHVRSVISCFIYSELVMELMADGDKFSAFKKMQSRVSGFLQDKDTVPQNELSLFDRILKSDISRLEESEIQSGTYVLEALEAVLWCFLRQVNYKDSVLEAVNLGGDTDTVAALVGGLAGIIYDVPAEWVNLLVKKNEVLGFIERFSKKLMD